MAKVLMYLAKNACLAIGVLCADFVCSHGHPCEQTKCASVSTQSFKDKT